jgi:hypothetical protein
VYEQKHFLADTARNVGQHFEGTAPFATERPHRGRGRPLASDIGHVSSMSGADQAIRGPKMATNVNITGCCNPNTLPMPF